MPSRLRLVPLTAVFCLLGSGVTLTPAGESPAVAKADVEALVVKAQNWLIDQQQPNGAFVPGPKYFLGVTALSVDALCTGPQALPASDPRIAKSIELLLSFQQPDGGVYDPNEGLGNYNTSLTLMALSAAGSGDPARIKKMQDYLFGSQNNTPGAIENGGMGYGSRGKGHEDLSNTSMAVEALRRSGVPASDQRLQKALAFMERCQELSSHNKAPWVGQSGQVPGGAVYSPDESKADGSWVQKPAEGAAPGTPPKLLPYGGMTYQLISSYVALDLKADDPRVAAALTWVKEYYRFDGNPGMQPGKERQGLFYYYMAMAKTFDLLDQGAMQLKDGKQVDWRVDLFKAISSQAQEVKTKDGKPAVLWINSEKRWAEDVPHLNGGYLLKALKRIAASL